MQLVWRWMRAAGAATGVLAATAGGAYADVRIGVALSAAAPAASLGIPEESTVAFLPKARVEIVVGKWKLAGE
ncbi:MAG: hypothetical protein JO239_01110 [Paraburkholderia sp.]|nr:hypothetical protein [Paraburkholderia sp.]